MAIVLMLTPNRSLFFASIASSLGNSQSTRPSRPTSNLRTPLPLVRWDSTESSYVSMLRLASLFLCYTDHPRVGFDAAFSGCDGLLRSTHVFCNAVCNLCVGYLGSLLCEHATS